MKLNRKAMSESGKLNRRTFIIRLLMAGSAFVGFLLSVPVIGALITPLLEKNKQVWRSLGNIDEYQVGNTVLVNFKNASSLPWAGITDKTAAWLRRVSENEFVAFSVNCTHLGCPVRWIEDADLFMCPCHGGVYNKDGSNAAGPPPLPLPKYPVRVRNNHVEILTSPIPITTLGEKTA